MRLRIGFKAVELPLAEAVERHQGDHAGIVATGRKRGHDQAHMHLLAPFPVRRAQHGVRGHAAALAWMNGREGVEVFNLGTGKGTSVLEIITAFGRACGKEIPYVIDPRRPGDVTSNYADCTKARELMGWEAKFDIDDMCRDSWNWQSKNPNGYEG